MSRRYGKGEIVTGGLVDYEIDDALSVGAFAVAYAARKPDGTRVFLKQYKSPSPLVDWYRPYIDYQQELKRRVCTNPLLVSRTYEFADFFVANRAFIQVFGFIEGGQDLREYILKGTLSLRQRWEFATLFLLTLQRFHDAGIVHSDLKPENVYLMPTSGPGGGWNVKLIDFDFTILVGQTPPWHGKMGYVGTPRYLSPEHLRGEMPSPPSDVFTAALIAWELLTSKGHPYPDDDDGYRADALAGNPPPPDFLVPATPELDAFGAALVRALSPDPAERPAAGTLSKLLREAREAFWHPGAKSGGDTSTPTPPPPPPPTASTAASPSGTPSGGSAPVAPSSPPPPPPSSSSAPPSAPPYSLVGAAGTTPPARVDLSFGRNNLAAAIGDDAVFANAEQFRIHRMPGQSGWWISLAAEPPKNPPTLNGAPLAATPVPLRDGDRIVAATSRTKAGVEKGSLTVRFV